MLLLLLSVYLSYFFFSQVSKHKGQFFCLSLNRHALAWLRIYPFVMSQSSTRMSESKRAGSRQANIFIHSFSFFSHFSKSLQLPACSTSAEVCMCSGEKFAFTFFIGDDFYMMKHLPCFSLSLTTVLGMKSGNRFSAFSKKSRRKVVCLLSR